MLHIKNERIQDYDWKNKYRINQSELASLFEVLDLKTGNYVAIKEYKTYDISNKIKSIIEAKLTAVKFVSGQCILKVIKTYTFQDFAYLITQLCETNLKKYLTKLEKRLEDHEIGHIIGHIVRGMKSILQNKCIHSSLNPWNILQNKNVWKLSDFTKPNENIHKELSTSFIKLGKFKYLAPQILIQTTQPTEISDVWSFGIIIYELVFGVHPFQKLDIDAFKKAISKNILCPQQQQINPQLKTLINACLKRSVQQRITWAEIFNNQFLDPFLKQKIVIPEIEEKDILSILNNLQQTAVLQLGSAEAVQRFCQGTLEWNEIKMVPQKLLNYEEFKNLCLILNQNMSLIDIRLLFRWIDISEDGYINQSQFANFLTSSEFGSILKNFFQSLSTVIQKKNIDAQQLFQNYDINNSGTLDQKEIRQIITVLLPNFSIKHLSLIIDHINKRFNGNLPIQRLHQQYEIRCLDDNNQQNLVKEQLQSFKNQWKQFQLTASQIVKNFDRNKNDKLDFQQFQKMVFSIGEFVRQKQLKMMFHQVDKDSSGHISVAELQKFFNSS